MPAVVPRLEGTPGRIAFAGEHLGHHNDEIYRGLLGKSETKMAALKASGVV